MNTSTTQHELAAGQPDEGILLQLTNHFDDSVVILHLIDNLDGKVSYKVELRYDDPAISSHHASFDFSDLREAKIKFLELVTTEADEVVSELG